MTEKSEYKGLEKSLADDGPHTRNVVLSWADFVVEHVPPSEVWTMHISGLLFVGPTQAKCVFTDRLPVQDASSGSEVISKHIQNLPRHKPEAGL